FLLTLHCFLLHYPLHTSPSHLTSPLSPYTTLFRSEPTNKLTSTGSPAGFTESTRASSFCLFSPSRPMTIPAIAINSKKIPISTEDRKSTRLNSSHVSISYAVFCLKKKKNK